MSSEKPPVNPRVLSLLIADAIHRDPATGKATILGVFNRLSAPSFPATHAIMMVYLAITEGYGTLLLHVRIVDVDEERQPLAGGTLTCTFKNPFDVQDVFLPFPKVTFPQPGDYRLQVICGDEVLAERRLMVSQRNRNTEEQQRPS